MNEKTLCGNATSDSNYIIIIIVINYLIRIAIYIAHKLVKGAYIDRFG